MAITIRNHTISTIVTSSIMGHSGGGMFPLTLFPQYRRLMRVVRETGTTNFPKSSTPRKNNGNFFLHKPWTWRFIQRLQDMGMLNAYGLTNGGVSVNAPAIALAQEAGFRVIPSLYPQFAKGRELAIREAAMAIYLYTTSLVEDFGQNFWAMELNLSCPNSREKIRENINDSIACVRDIRTACPDLCLIGKISIVHPHEFVQELVRVGVDIIHAINTIPYNLVYDYPPSPLQGVGGGGVSGGPAFGLALDYNRELRRKINVPMIMGCGVMSVADAMAYFDAGADAVSICTVCRLNPKEAIRIIQHYVSNEFNARVHLKCA